MANNKPTFALLPGQSTLNPAQQNQLIQSFKNKANQSSSSAQWQDITNKPSVFPSAAHTHSESEVLNLKQDLLKAGGLAQPATITSLGSVIVGAGLAVSSLGLLSVIGGMARVNNIVPVGVIDGTNKIFTLPSVPVPGTEEVFMGSGRLFPVSDYTLSGATVTFIQGVQPAPGDSIHASYFLAVVTGNRVNNEIPTGTIDGSNLIFSIASLTIAATEEIYVGAGRVFPPTDYTLSGTTITFVSGSQPLIGDSIHASYFK